MVINRRALRDDVRTELVAKIFSGAFAPGEKINELDLAAELSVSRTPIREAMTMLVQEGVLESVPGKGFALLPVTPEVVRDVYPLIAALEGFAIRSSHPLDLAALAPELDAIAERMLCADGNHEVQELDDEWHAKLCGAYSNAHLEELLERLKRRVHRYELTLFADRRSVEASVGEHRAIAEALTARDIDRAVAMLDVNWRMGMQRLLTWMSQETPATT